MGLDEDLATAIETKLTALSISAVVLKTKDMKSTQVPWISVNTNGAGSRTHADLSTFYRKEFPFNIECRGSSDDDADALEDAVESALMTLSATITSGWLEFETGIKQEVQKKYQKWIVGKKILYTDVS